MSTEYRPEDAPAGVVSDNDYASRTGQNQIPVQSDDKTVEDPINPETADSDATLGMWSFLLLSFPIHADSLLRTGRACSNERGQHHRQSYQRRHQAQRYLPGAR